MILTEEEIKEVLGDDADGFLNVLRMMEHMIDRPEDFIGQKALLEAVRLSAYRTKIGATANWLKTGEKNILTRRRKDLLLSMEANLVENINALKLSGRIDAKASGIM